jgi:hypothetical protein
MRTIAYPLALALSILSCAGVGCGGTAESSPPGDASGATASPDASSNPSSPDAGGVPADDASLPGAKKGALPKKKVAFAGACPAHEVVSAADLDAESGWRPAVATPGACTAGDLTKLQDNFSDSAITTWIDVGNGLTPSCKACAISYDTAAHWQPIVATQANAGATGFINFGACYGQLEGPTCGKALQYERFCINVNCGGCESSAKEYSCTNAALREECSALEAGANAACPKRQTSDAYCGSVFAAVKKLCG